MQEKKRWSDVEVIKDVQVRTCRRKEERLEIVRRMKKNDGELHVVKSDGIGKQKEGIRKKEHKVRIFHIKALGVKWQHAVL